MTFRCDSCGQPIEKAEDGWVEWISLSQQKPGGRDLRLVHRFSASPRAGGRKCQFDSKEEHQKDRGIIGDSVLTDFLGPDGLMYLLGFLAGDDLPKTEVLEMIKRLHVPGYEEARHSIKAATSSGEVELNTRPGFPSQSEIAAVLKFKQRRSQE